MPLNEPSQLADLPLPQRLLHVDAFPVILDGGQFMLLHRVQVGEKGRPPPPSTSISYTLKQVSPPAQESVTHTKTPPFRTRIPWEEKGGKNVVVAKRLTDRLRY